MEFRGRFRGNAGGGCGGSAQAPLRDRGKADYNLNRESV
jgi:hypothetical protein